MEKEKRMPSKYSWRVFASLMLVFGIFLGAQYQQNRIAELQAEEAQAAFAVAYQAEAAGNRDYAAQIVLEQAANGYYDEYLMRELLFGQGLAMRLEGHQDVVKAVAVSHDGLYIASGGGDPWAESKDNRVLIWDMSTGEPLAACEGHSNSVTSVAFSPINDTVLSGSRDGTMRLWNWQNGACETLMIFAPQLGTMAHWEATSGTWQGAWIWDVAFTPDGTSVISAGKDGTLIRWDIATGHPQQQFIYSSRDFQRPWVNTVAISPDASFMISGADSVTYGGDERYLLMSHSLLAEDAVVGSNVSFIGNRNHVISVAINPVNPNFFLSASRDGSVRYWNRETGNVNETNGVPNVFSAGGEETDIQSVAISPDGTMAAIGTGFGDGTGIREIYLWDLTDWHPIDVYEDLTGSVWDLAFSPDGSQLVSAMSDGSVLVWNVTDRGYTYHGCTGRMLALLEARFGR